MTQSFFCFFFNIKYVNLKNAWLKVGHTCSISIELYFVYGEAKSKKVGTKNKEWKKRMVPTYLCLSHFHIKM